MSATMSSTEIHNINKEFIKEALIGLDAPQDIIQQVSEAVVVSMQTTNDGVIRVGLVDIFGRRVSWSLT